jgi:hypothetical protein
MFKGKKKFFILCGAEMVWGLVSIDLAYNWGLEGHRVIGAVAKSNLAPETKKY